MRSRLTAAVGLTLLAAGCSSPPDTITINGVVELHAPDYTATEGCTGQGSLLDVRVGAPVIVSGADGTPLDVTVLSDATADQVACVLAFTAEVPAGRGPYAFEVGAQRPHRYPEHQVADGDVVIRLRQSFLGR